MGQLESDSGRVWAAFCVTYQNRARLRRLSTKAKEREKTCFHLI